MTEAMFFTIGRSRISGQQILGLRPNTDAEADSTKNCDSIIFDLNVNSTLVSFKHKTQLYFNLCKKQTIFFGLFWESNEKKMFSLDIVTFPFKNFVTIATRICFPLVWIVSRIFTRCDCVKFFLQLPQENEFPLHESFNESTLLVIVQAVCYNCHKKISFSSMKSFMNL